MQVTLTERWSQINLSLLYDSRGKTLSDILMISSFTLLAGKLFDLPIVIKIYPWYSIESKYYILHQIIDYE